MQNPKPELTPLALSDLDALFDAVLDTSESITTAESIYKMEVCLTNSTERR